MPVERLPDDLAELAGQLVDDAARLAERYPAPLTAARAAGAPAPRRGPLCDARGLALTAAAVLALAAGVGLWATGDLADQPARMSRPATASRPATVVAAADASDARVTDDRAALNRRAGVDASEPMPHPLVSWEWFTDAEQEAVLDLFEEEGLEQASVSI